MAFAKWLRNGEGVADAAAQHNSRNITHHPPPIRLNERISTSRHVFYSSRSDMKFWVEVSGINMESCLISAGLTLIKDSEVGAWRRRRNVVAPPADGRDGGRRAAARWWIGGSQPAAALSHIASDVSSTCLLNGHTSSRSIPFYPPLNLAVNARDELASISPHFSTHYPSADDFGRCIIYLIRSSSGRVLFVNVCL